MRLDTLLIVPFEPDSGSFYDPIFRRVAGSSFIAPYLKATHQLEAYVGRRLDWWHPRARPHFGGKELPFPAHRSLAAVVLATHLERAGLLWEAVDPGAQELGYWRRRLRMARGRNPRTVAVSTTFILSEPWLQALCDVVRRELPSARLLIGGYYYATNARKFLDLDADVFCVGEGEERYPQIVRATRDGRSLDGIPGLYVRQTNGTIYSTGPAIPLDMNALPPVNWALAERIEPPVDLNRDVMEFEVETQRGCVFKCDFCTYRTLASPSLLSPKLATDAILATRIFPDGFIYMPDATATYPHDRWEEMMNILIQHGGSPHPIGTYARVSDINEERASLMERAGVRHLFIGQESGDQAMLNAMKKGTRVDQVKPALAALGRHRIKSIFSFICGFPGETPRSIENTRHLIATLNEGLESQPVVMLYTLYPFSLMDFASVSQQEPLRGIDHYIGYEQNGVSATRAIEEILATYIAVSRVPHAPAFLFVPPSAPTTHGMRWFCSPHRYEMFRWWKAVERGTAIFLERDLEGHSSHESELRRVREEILLRCPSVPQWRSMACKARSLVLRGFLRRLGKEWASESTKGPGTLTRTRLFLAALRDTGSLKTAGASCFCGTYRLGGATKGSDANPPEHEQVATLADELISEVLSPKRASRAKVAGQVSPVGPSPPP